MKKTNKIFKGIVIVMVSLLVLLVGTAKAQVFIEDYDQSESSRAATEDFNFIVMYEGSDVDAYVPISDGVLLLVGLGGAYLLTNRKKHK